MSSISKRSLKDLLDNNVDIQDIEMESEHEHELEPENVCCECGNQPKELQCLNCEEPFCGVCFDFIHRTGKRKEHEVETLTSPEEATNAQTADGKSREGPGKANKLQEETQLDQQSTDETQSQEALGDYQSSEIVSNGSTIVNVASCASFIPMRLTAHERKLFRLLVAALDVSEYTDRVDIYMYSSKAQRIAQELRGICTVLTGLVVANGMDIGKMLVEDGDFSAHAEWFQSVFEVGRRYKIMNPERMRSSFGKMVYMIMDSRLPEVKQILDFDLYKPVMTVQSYLEEQHCAEVLQDPLIDTATMEIVAANKSRQRIQREIKTKENAIEKLVARYGEPVRQAMYSLGDYNAYLNFNKMPVETMIAKLKSDFDSTDAGDPQYSLGISSGRNGARLSHDHRKQYQYVLQSLTLWQEIMNDMYLLWKLADDDLLSNQYRYRLEDTGQGLNRIKPSPQVSRKMHSIISRAQKQTGTWVGSSVVHLGDRAVPNALFFLDKYLQVPRILNPINNVLQLLPKIIQSDTFAAEWVVSQFKSFENLERTILVDFFRYAFDGSGADNFYDAGSCIDGRLTSAWNWANKLPKKPYYKFFLVTGFVGFDGTEGF